MYADNGNVSSHIAVTSGVVVAGLSIKNQMKDASMQRSANTTMKHGGDLSGTMRNDDLQIFLSQWMAIERSRSGRSHNMQSDPVARNSHSGTALGARSVVREESALASPSKENGRLGNAAATDLQRFITQFVQIHIETWSQPNQRTHFRPDTFEELLSRLAPLINDVRHNGTLVNVWSIAGLDRSEVRVARVLKWLLDRYEDHGQGGAWACSLVRAAYRKYASSIDVTEGYGFPTPSDVLSAHYRTDTEVCQNDEHGSRVDIELSGSFLLVIEIKIDANENGNQIEKYHRTAAKKANGRPFGVIYITPTGCLPNSLEALPNVASLSWSDTASALKHHVVKLSRQSVLRHYIYQFCKYITNL